MEKVDLTGGRSFSEEPSCPVCGVGLSYSSYGEMDDNEEECDCDNCGQSFLIRCQVVREWETELKTTVDHCICYGEVYAETTDYDCSLQCSDCGEMVTAPTIEEAAQKWNEHKGETLNRIYPITQSPDKETTVFVKCIICGDQMEYTNRPSKYTLRYRIGDFAKENGWKVEKREGKPWGAYCPTCQEKSSEEGERRDEEEK